MSTDEKPAGQNNARIAVGTEQKGLRVPPSPTPLAQNGLLVPPPPPQALVPSGRSPSSDVQSGSAPSGSPSAPPVSKPGE